MMFSRAPLVLLAALACAAISDVYGATPLISLELICISDGWFGCESQAMDLMFWPAPLESQSEPSSLGRVFGPAAFDLAQTVRVLNTFDESTKTYYAFVWDGPMPRGTMFAVDTVKKTNVSYPVPSTYGTQTASSLTFDNVSKRLVIGYGDSVVAFDPVSNKYTTLAKNIFPAKTTALTGVAALSTSGMLATVGLQSSDSGESNTWAFFIVDLQTGSTTQSPWVQGAPSLGSFTPVWMDAGPGGFMVLYSGDLGPSLSFTDVASTNVTKSLVTFSGFAGLGWTVNSRNSGVYSWQKEQGILLMDMVVGGQNGGTGSDAVVSLTVPGAASQSGVAIGRRRFFGFQAL